MLAIVAGLRIVAEVVRVQEQVSPREAGLHVVGSEVTGPFARDIDCDAHLTQSHEVGRLNEGIREPGIEARVGAGLASRRIRIRREQVAIVERQRLVLRYAALNRKSVV